MRAAPGVDALGIVAHDHDVLVARGQQINQIALDFVGVLVFVHQDELEPALKFSADFAVFPQEFEPEGEQVVEVHAVGRFFAVGVFLLQGADLRSEGGE